MVIGRCFFEPVLNAHNEVGPAHIAAEARPVLGM
jgi:hypothetical protein